MSLQKGYENINDNGEDGEKESRKKMKRVKWEKDYSSPGKKKKS